MNELIPIFQELWGENTERTEINPSDYKGYPDGSNVMCIIPKNEECKKLIEGFGVNKNNLVDVKGKFEFKSENNDKECLSRYSMEYLSKILAMCKNYGSVKIKMKKDYPLWVETHDFICVLAPRVESEDEN
jgi:hypothetical protein